MRVMRAAMGLGGFRCGVEEQRLADRSAHGVFRDAGGLGQQMDASMKMFNGSEVCTMLIVFVLLVWLADQASAWLRRALVCSPSGSR